MTPNLDFSRSTIVTLSLVVVAIVTIAVTSIVIPTIHAIEPQELAQMLASNNPDIQQEGKKIAARLITEGALCNAKGGDFNFTTEICVEK